MRLPFLTLTVASVFLGICTSLQTRADISFYEMLLVLAGAIAAHISVNTFNEYFDFGSGLDAQTVKTPFSGGSGALIDEPAAAGAVLCLAVITLGIAILIGVYFIYSRGPLILPIGIVGVLIILSYTQWLNRYPLLCLLAPGVGFGPLMVVGTYIVLTGESAMPPYLVSLVPFFLASNLLLLNQYPDIEADARVGRRHFPIVFGVKRSTILYGFFAMAVCVTIVLGVLTGVFPRGGYISLIPLSAALVAFWGAREYALSVDKLTPYLAMNVLAAVLTPVLLGVAIAYG